MKLVLCGHRMHLSYMHQWRQRANFTAPGCMYVCMYVCTAWDSEIESLTSLIKLHQSERRSAPCGQIGAATQPPEPATSWSPTLKKFWVARAFEVRWTCTCCRGRAVSNCYSFYHLLISVFFFVSLAVLKNTNIAEQVRSVDDTCLILWPATSGIDNAFDPATNWLQKWIVALHNPKRSLNSRVLSTPAPSNVLMTPRRSSPLVRCRHAQQQPFRALRSSKNEPQQRENERKGKREHECLWSFPGWLLPTLHGFFRAPDFNDRMSDHDEPPVSQKARSFEKEGDGKPCFSDAELACRLALQGRRQLLLGSNAAVTRCLRCVFLRSSSIKLASSDVSDSISLSQAVCMYVCKMWKRTPYTKWWFKWRLWK